MALSRWLRSGRTDRVAEGEIKELTDQFYVTLRAYVAGVKTTGGKRAPAAVERVDELLRADRPRTWGEAYEIEQLLVHVFDDETLKTELQRRGLEAEGTLRGRAAEFYTKEVTAATTAERQRSLLSRLVNDLQWRYTVNEVKRRYSKDITSRTGWLFATTLLAFSAWTAYLVTKPQSSDLHLLILSGLAGAWGAAFSMLWSLKSRLDASELDDLKLMRLWVMLPSRALIGAGAGCILYFFLRAGLLAGGIFPSLTNIDDVSKPGKDLALIIVWGFIAGFSEKLVPGLLEKTESKAGAAPATVPDRFRPGPASMAAPETEPAPRSPAKPGDTLPQPGSTGAREPTRTSPPSGSS